MATLSQNRPRWKRSLGVVGYALFLVFVLLIAAAAGWLRKSPVLTRIVLGELGLAKKPAEVFNSSSQTFLILGCDEDLAPGGKVVLKKEARSDMMLVAKLDFANNLISGLSIPRDMECTIDGKTHKINAFHGIGGPPLAKRAAETLLGVPIDRVIVLDYNAFQEMVNLVGGIDVDVDKNLKYTDKAGGLFIDIKKGHQHLDGYNAMCFVRFRHADDDFHRQARQKQFLTAFKAAVLRNKMGLTAITEQAAKVLGSELQADEVATLALFAQGVPATNIKLGMVPARDSEANPLELDSRKLKSALVEYGLASPKGTQVTNRS